jgi:hypothetical protein
MTLEFWSPEYESEAAPTYPRKLGEKTKNGPCLHRQITEEDIWQTPATELAMKKRKPTRLRETDTFILLRAEGTLANSCPVTSTKQIKTLSLCFRV